MELRNDHKKRVPSLRNRAEDELKNTMEKLPELSIEQIQKLIHDLHTHQIELEMQNQELALAQEELQAGHEKYIALYDFAPVGYFTLSEEGTILEVNLTGAVLLGWGRRTLKNKRITDIILSDDQDVFYRYRQNLLMSNTRRSCELRIKTKTTHIWVLISGVKVEPKHAGEKITINITMTDITQRVADEIKIRNANDELSLFKKLMVNREIRMIELKKKVNELHRRLGEEDEFPK